MASLLISITGLQNLPNLQNFNADYNAMQTMDFSGLTNLTYVDISDCDELGSSGLKSINVTGCTALTDIRLDDNDFSAGFPDLSSCTSLQFFDADQCGISGSLNLSNLPALQGFDLYGNGQLTEVIISSTQPLGDGGRNLNFSACSLTQTALDNILQQLSSGSVNGGNIDFSQDGGGNNALPSLNRGLPAFRNLVVNKGWNYTNDGYFETITATTVYSSSAEACTALGNNETSNLYIYTGTNIEVGNYIFTDTELLYPVPAGFIATAGDGSWSYQISGSNGLIVSQSACGA